MTKETNKYPSLCMYCICTSRLHPVMLTGYCIQGERCDGCRRVGDLAMCSMPEATK